MTRSLRIAVADDELDMRDYFRRCLTSLGHQVVAVCENGQELVERCRQTEPDLVITDIRMPGLDGIEAAGQIFRERSVPIILISAFHDSELIGRAELDHVMGYLVKPTRRADLEPAIALALQRFEQIQALRREVDTLRNRPAEPKS
jgi:response regulator NasT